MKIEAPGRGKSAGPWLPQAWHRQLAAPTRGWLSCGSVQDQGSSSASAWEVQEWWLQGEQGRALSSSRYLSPGLTLHSSHGLTSSLGRQRCTGE